MRDQHDDVPENPDVLEGELVSSVEEPTPAPVPDVGYTVDGVPTFDHVRERIEGRVATASGAGELDAAMPEVQDLEKQEADRAAAGRDKLEEIRRAMRGGA